MQYLLPFLVALGLVTVLGYALWLLLALVIRSLFRRKQAHPEHAGEARQCPGCGRFVPGGRRWCEWCGLALDSSRARELTDLESTRRQLGRFLAKNIIDQATFADLVQLVKTRQRQLLGQEPSKAPVPQTPVEAGFPIPPAPLPTKPEEILTAIAAEDEPAPEPIAIEPELPAWPGLEEGKAPPSVAVATPAVFPVENVPAEVPAALPAELPPEPATPQRQPRRSIAEVLAAFMEERNILWGELVGGLLIVGCSIMLVISLRKALAEIPYSPFLIFAAITAALFGAGLYTLHHWKLDATSRGLLVIATLLVPLNFLVMAGLPKEQTTGWLEALIYSAFLTVFAWLVMLAARALVSGEPWFLTAAVVGCSGLQLLIPWVLKPESSTLWMYACGLSTAACYFFGSGGTLIQTARSRDAQPALATNLQRILSLFISLGIATFAAVVAFGLLVYQSGISYWDGDIAPALERLAFLAVVAGIPILASGLMVHQRLAGETELGAVRTAGTAIALVGMLVMLAAVVLAWPLRPAVLVVCALDFVALTYVAFRYELPIAHAAALPCLVLGYLAAFDVLQNPGSKVLDASVLSSESGLALAGLFFLLGLTSELLVRGGWKVHGTAYVMAAGAVAVLSLVLVTWPAPEFEASGRVAALYAFYGAGCLAVNARWRWPMLSTVGLALLMAATLWGLRWQLAPIPVVGATLAGEALLMALLAVGLRFLVAAPNQAAPAGVAQPVVSARLNWLAACDFLREPLARSAEGIGILAVLAAVWGGVLAMSWAFGHVITGSCLLVVYLLLAGSERRSGLARLAGLMMIGTATATAGWWATSLPETSQLTPPQFMALIAFGIALAGAAMTAVATIAAVPRQAGISAAAGRKNPFGLPWYGVLPAAWLQTGFLAGVMALALSFFALDAETIALPPCTLGLVAATAFLLAWGYQAVWLTWAGSALTLAAFAHVLIWHYAPGVFPTPWLNVAFLGHATVAFLANQALGHLSWRRQAAASSDTEISTSPHRRWWQTIDRIFTSPLGQSALASSAVALPLLLTIGWGQWVAPAVCLFWLALIWLAISSIQRWPALFTASQAILALAILCATTAWLERQPWFVNYRADLGSRFWDPWTLQAYGLGLGFLSMLWMAVRVPLAANTKAQHLLEPGWPALDRCLFFALVVGQLGLTVEAFLPSLVQEFSPTTLAIALWPDAVLSHAFGPAAWGLVGLLACTCVVALWERSASAAVLGLLILGLTVPVLAAGWFVREQAAGPALCWGLGISFLMYSVPLWDRARWSGWVRRLGCRVDASEGLLRLSRGLLILGVLVPVLVLTLITGGVRLAGGPAAWPLPDSFFGNLNWIFRTALPLVLLTAGLAGHALRERSPAYAFAAGLVANLTVTGCYALAFTGIRPPEELWIQLIQLATITTALWAVVWLLMRWWLLSWRPGLESPFAQPLLRWQVGIGLAGNAALIGWAVWLLTALSPPVTSWIREAGSPMGWSAFLLATAAVTLHVIQQRLSFRPKVVGLFGLAAMGLLACSIERWTGGLGYRALMLAFGGYALVWSLAGWQVATVMGRRGAALESEEVTEAADFWVALAGLLSVALGIQEAFGRSDRIWSAVAIGLASAAGVVQAIWRQREAWAFASGLGINLASSLVTWYLLARLGIPGSQWWVCLIQANVITASVVGLCWLAMRKRLYETSRLNLRSSPFLACQVAMGFLGTILLMVVAVVLLVLIPGKRLPIEVLRIGNPWGTLSVFLALLGAAWYTWQVVPRALIHVLCAFGLSLGVLLACNASRQDQSNWLAYHALLTSWTLTGVAVLAAGYSWVHFLRFAPTLAGSPPPEASDHSIGDLSYRIRSWVVWIAVTVFFLAVRGTWDDPGKPYWSVGSTLAVSALAGVLACWSGWPVYVYASGLLVNVVGFMVWIHWGPSTAASFVYSQILCLAIASASWSSLELMLRQRPRPADLRGRLLPFSHFAAVLALSLSACLVAVATSSSLQGVHVWAGGPWAWTALGATAVAMAICLWDPAAHFVLAGLYTVGLTALGLILHGADLAPRDFCWTAALVLALYTLLAAAVFFAVLRFQGLFSALRVAPQSSRQALAWFMPAQAVLVGAVVGLSIWTCVDFVEESLRLAGPLACGTLAVAGILMASASSGLRRSLLQFMTLGLGVIVLAELGWALQDPAGREPAWLWLHRSVWLMVALAVMTAFYGVVLARSLPPQTSWADSSRYSGPMLAVLAATMLAVVLVQEASLYEAPRALAKVWATMLQIKVVPAPDGSVTPMAPAAIVIVAIALLGLVAAGLCFAVMPGQDPFGLSQRGRKGYVYASEVVLVLMFVHLRLTAPRLFHSEVFAHYWPFVIMALAFLGAFLSEVFERRGIPVLAEPLERTGVFLPMLPVLAFWFLPQNNNVLPEGNYAFIWFLTGLLYGLLSVAKHSFRWALLAALAANVGLWVLWHQHQISFWKHPQLWLIPLAVIVLVAEHLNRDRLTRYQSTALQYAALVVIYVSSTADMFIAGLGRTWHLPLILAVLSVFGILLGMLLRVRAFLFLGTTFLLLVILMMIWHAGVDLHQVWILWASGIVLGVAILALFGIFEKRRNDVLRLIKELKEWD